MGKRSVDGWMDDALVYLISMHSLCLHDVTPARLAAHVFLCLSVCLFPFFSFCQKCSSSCLTYNFLSLCLSAYVSIYLSILPYSFGDKYHSFACLTCILMSLRLSICLYVCPSVCLSAFPILISQMPPSHSVRPCRLSRLCSRPALAQTHR